MDGGEDLDDWDSDSLEDPDLEEDGEDLATIDCPYCGREILEDAVQCPYCENYISAEDSPAERKPLWLLLAAALGLLSCGYFLVAHL